MGYVVVEPPRARGPRPGVTPLGERIAALIEANGPMPVSDYMALCLFDPQHGYYTTRQPFGATGDFTTAPEISQMFGELVAAWLAHGWREMGSPSNAIVAEIGPGRGTLMLDVVRTLRRIAPALIQKVHLVETSPRLRDMQGERLAGADITAEWHETIDTLPEAPSLVVANELFDAVPTRQFVSTGDRWLERCVVLRDGTLAFGTGTASLPFPKAEVGTIREIAPARDALMARIAMRLTEHDGLFLAFDYGHEGGTGDTLQAVRDHAPVDPLATPGEADLTTHVDFRALANAARSTGAHVLGPLAQGEFLLGLGLLERAGALGAGKDEAEQNAIRDAVERLAGPDGMGTLFRVMAVSGRERALPPFA